MCRRQRHEPMESARRGPRPAFPLLTHGLLSARCGRSGQHSKAMQRRSEPRPRGVRFRSCPPSSALGTSSSPLDFAPPDTPCPWQADRGGMRRINTRAAPHRDVSGLRRMNPRGLPDQAGRGALWSEVIGGGAKRRGTRAEQGTPGGLILLWLHSLGVAATGGAVQSVQRASRARAAPIAPADRPAARRAGCRAARPPSAAAAPAGRASANR
jgi:hypothetical protein